VKPPLRKPAELAGVIREANDESVRATVVAMRKLEPRPTYEAIGDIVGLSKQRVQRICVEELGEEGQQ
jgi:DNA polymerase III psi subunit